MVFILALAAAPLATSGPIDFPLGVNTRWIYQKHVELGPGVHFDEEDAKLAKGNILDTTEVWTVTGQDMIGGTKYARVECVSGGRLLTKHWYASATTGLLLGKTFDDGSEIAMSPPRRLIIPEMRPGSTWNWKDTVNPISSVAKVVGTGPIRVPAGGYQAVETSHAITVRTEGMPLEITETVWFVSAIGFVKDDTETHVGSHPLIHTRLTLEKFEPAR